MARYRYNTQFEPPAPFVLVRIGRPRHLDADAELLPAQVDTAADLTVVPWTTIAPINLTAVDKYPVLGFGSEPQEYPRFLVELAIHGVAAHIVVPVLASPDEKYVLLGRDVLNRFQISLDGASRLLTIE
jgi:hypothetical protein